MTQWVLHGPSSDQWQLGGDADFEDPKDESGVVRVRGVYLESDEVRAHIESGRQVVRLALGLNDQLNFVLQELALTRLRFSDEVKAINEEMHEDPWRAAMPIACLWGDITEFAAGVGEPARRLPHERGEGL